MPRPERINGRLIYKDESRPRAKWVVADKSGPLHYRNTREEAIAATVRRKEKTMIEKLKNLVVAKFSLEELIELRANARTIYSEYQTQKVAAPEWLNDAVVSLDREIRSQVHDELARKLSEAKARRSQLRTTEEKRGDLDKEIAELENALA